MALDSTPRSDYAHWNEDQDYMWYMEVGRFADTEEPADPDEEFEYPDWDNRHHDDLEDEEEDPE